MSTPDPHAVPGRVGPYIVDEVAGRGGMGVVYRAHHAVTGEPVALKTVLAVRPDLASFLDREIAGLARIDHPQVVSIVGHGSDDAGRPWLAMRWLDGKDLSDVLPPPIQAGETVSEARLDQAIRIAARLCPPLGWMHGNALVHGDIKPSNVRVSGGVPTLLDLGLAQAMRDLEGRESSVGAGELAWSRGYTAPEQRRGELLDGRADLWSLGAVILAMLTGRPPSARDPEASIAKLAGVAQGWRDLLRDLLRDDPRDRPAFAEDVALRIAELGGPVVAVDARPTLHRPRCIGREPLIEALVEVGQRGGVHGIVGTSGRGKTRVVLEVASRLTRRRKRLIGAAAERGDLHPYGLLAPLLRAVARHAQRVGAAATQQALAAVMPVLRTVSTELDQVDGLAGTAQAGVVDPDLARTRLARAVWQATGWFAHGLFFDDVQWADPRFLDLLPAMIATRPDDRALLLAWRDDEAPPALHALSIPVHTLGHLSDPAVTDLLSDMLADRSVLTGTVAEITEWAEGNPWFAAEMLRAAVESGALSRSAGRWTRSGDLPAARTVERLVDARWAALDEEERATVEVAAVLGREWSPELVGSILQRVVATPSLARRGWVERAGEGRWAFTHATLRDGVLTRMEPDLACRRHRQAADVLTEQRGSSRFLDIAHHRAAAGQRQEAIHTYLDIARGHPYLEPDVVIAAAEALLGMGDEVPRETQVLALLWMGTDHSYMHRMAESQAARERLLRDYRDIEGVERLVLGMQIEVDRGVKPLEDNLALCRRALTLPRFRDRTHDVFLLSMSGNMLADVGRVREAIVQFERAVSRVDDGARAHMVRSLYMCLGKAYGALHRWEDMEAWFTKVLEVSDTVGMGQRATMEWCRAQREIATDDLAGAHRRLLACRELFVTLAGPRQLLGTDASLAEVELASGEEDAAWTRIDAACRANAGTPCTALWQACLVRARLAHHRGEPVDDADLGEIEARSRRAEASSLVLRARLERTWGQTIGEADAAEVEGLLEGCADLLQPNSLLERLVRAWSEARPR